MPVDLQTEYMGLKLRNPIVVSACPLTAELDNLRRLEDMGAAAAVLPSLFAEQIGKLPGICDSQHAFVTDELGQSLSHFRELKHYNRGPDAYLEHIEAAKRAVSMPIIASINGTNPGNWTRQARLMQDAGADALELNLYSVVTDLNVTAAQIEQRYLDLVSSVRQQITIPLAVKLSPSFTALGNMASRLASAGANGLVLFNRFMQPDIDLDALKVCPHLVLSDAEELRIRLRWIAILYGRVDVALAATGGIGFPDGVLKALLAGADVVEIASVLYRLGIEQIGQLVAGVAYWMETNEFPSVTSLKGLLSQKRCPDPAAYERANYTHAVCTFMAD